MGDFDEEPSPLLDSFFVQRQVCSCPDLSVWEPEGSGATTPITSMTPRRKTGHLIAAPRTHGARIHLATPPSRHARHPLYRYSSTLQSLSRAPAMCRHAWISAHACSHQLVLLVIQLGNASRALSFTRRAARWARPAS